MPTKRPRHVITETDQIVRALDDAARRWPADRGNRARLLDRLVAEGHRAVLKERERDAAARGSAIDRTRGALTGAYGEGYLAELREDWPEWSCSMHVSSSRTSRPAMPCTTMQAISFDRSPISPASEPDHRGRGARRASQRRQAGPGDTALAQLAVQTVPLGDDGPVRLAMLRAETRLKMPDCCVLLSAEQVGMAQVATFDDRLGAAARQRGFIVIGRRGRIPEA